MFIDRHEVSIDDPVILKLPVIIRALKGLSIHEVELRKSKSGNHYYMFYSIDGLCVTNYQKAQFDALNKVIPIEDESLFLFENGLIWPIDQEYRTLFK